MTGPNFPDTGNSFYYSRKTFRTDIVVDPARQSGVHLWREQRFYCSLLGSDALIAEIKARQLKFFQALKVTDLKTD